jgi:hypothetical protein
LEGHFLSETSVQLHPNQTSQNATRSFNPHIALSASHTSLFVPGEKLQDLCSSPDIKVISHREDMTSKAHGTQGQKEKIVQVNRKYCFFRFLEMYMKRQF